MSYTGVVWESRSTEQLARDLTDGPGPALVGGAGAAWQRIANAFTAAAGDYRQVLDRVRAAWVSEHSPDVLARLQEFGDWLDGKAVNAAANGQRAESAAVAATVAILAMPTVEEAVEARARHDMMASLAAYNGAVLTGSFAALDAAAATDHASAATVMAQYETASAPLATPWPEPAPPQVVGGAARQTQQDSGSGAGAGGGVTGGGSVPVAPLVARPLDVVKSSEHEQVPRRVSYVSAAGAGTGGMPYAPYAPLTRGYDGDREYESPRPLAALAGGGEAGAGVSRGEPSWLPAAEISAAPASVDSVSWAPDTVAVDGPEDAGATEGVDRALQPLTDRWVAPAVLGDTREDQ